MKSEATDSGTDSVVVFLSVRLILRNLPVFNAMLSSFKNILDVAPAVTGEE
jgi:hypothetical protein